ncbi:MAG: hypothetical protein WAV46_01505 [Candidatus Moraniibacteriota bacterium]
MRKYLRRLQKKIRGMDTDAKYVAGAYLFVFMFVGTAGVLAASGWHPEIAPSTRVRPAMMEKIIPAETKSLFDEKEDVVEKQSVSTKKAIQPIEPSNVTDVTLKTDQKKADQIKTDELKKQLKIAKEIERQAKESFDELKKTLSTPIAPPPAIKPFPVAKAPEPIKVDLPTTHYTTTCWDDFLLGKQCKTTMSVY